MGKKAGKSETVRHMEEAYLPFGAGPRVCPGQVRWPTYSGGVRRHKVLQLQLLVVFRRCRPSDLLGVLTCEKARCMPDTTFLRESLRTFTRGFTRPKCHFWGVHWWLYLRRVDAGNRRHLLQHFEESRVRVRLLPLLSASMPTEAEHAGSQDFLCCRC